jgi:REP element-mobilizing transposase RayT
MARPLRLEFSDSIYRLTSRGNTRQRSFFSDTDRASFLNTLSQVISRYRCICHAYCLMANHYHLFIETPKPSPSTGLVKHRELVADRRIAFAEIVGRENVIAGTDCGLGAHVHPPGPRSAPCATARRWR